MISEQMNLLLKYIPRDVHTKLIAKPMDKKDCFIKAIPPPGKILPIPIKKSALNAICSPRLEELCYLKIRKNAKSPMRNAYTIRSKEMSKDDLLSEDDEDDFSTLSLKYDDSTKEDKRRAYNAEDKLRKLGIGGKTKDKKDGDKSSKSLKKSTPSPNKKGKKGKSGKKGKDDDYFTDEDIAQIYRDKRDKKEGRKKIEKRKSKGLGEEKKLSVYERLNKLPDRMNIHEQCKPYYLKEKPSKKIDWKKTNEWLEKNAKPKPQLLPEVNRGIIKPLSELLPTFIRLSQPRGKHHTTISQIYPKRKHKAFVLSERNKALAMPKPVNEEYLEDLNYNFYKRLKNAKRYQATQRIKELAVPFDPRNATHNCFADLPSERPEDQINERAFEVNPNALKYKPTERILKLAAPRERPPEDVNPFAFKVNPKALKYQITPRMEELAKPIERPVEENVVTFQVKPSALNYKATPRIIELAKPKSYTNFKHNCFRPQPEDTTDENGEEQPNSIV